MPKALRVPFSLILLNIFESNIIDLNEFLICYCIKEYLDDLGRYHFVFQQHQQILNDSLLKVFGVLLRLTPLFEFEGKLA